MAFNYFMVALGGAVGAVSRFGLSQAIGKTSSFPFATLLINLIGSLIIGILFGLQQQERLPEKYWLLLAVGLCGGFTTFSAFSLENMALLQQHKWLLFGAYVTASVAACLLTVYLGYSLSNK